MQRYIAIMNSAFSSLFPSAIRVLFINFSVYRFIQEDIKQFRSAEGRCSAEDRKQCRD